MASFPRYLATSVAALVVDYGLLLGITRLHAGNRTLVAVTTYIVGALVHYRLSRRYVFEPGWLHHMPRREFALFLASGLLGALLTAAVFWASAQAGMDNVTIQKALAVLASFTATYLLRKNVVFGGAWLQ
jgi:putative flippase GtrA